MKLDFHIAYEKLTCACWYCGFCIWMKREQDSEVNPQLFVFPVVYLVYVPHEKNWIKFILLLNGLRCRL